MKLIEEEECYFVEGLQCKWPIPEDILKDGLERSEPDAECSLRPFEDSGTCTNCLLGMVLNTLQ